MKKALLSCCLIFFSCKLSDAKNIIQKDICQTAPEGMVCVKGSEAIIGRLDTSLKKNQSPLKKKYSGLKWISTFWQGERSPAIEANDLPQFHIYISTFYLDKYEVTNEAYNKCVKAGHCKRFWNYKHRLYNGYRKPQLPAVPVSYTQAFEYCRWAGKRLPSENEWEKAARGERGDLYPWGNEKPSCKVANYQDCRKGTVNVGSYPSGHYGEHDLAGNGYEWVNDWASSCRVGCKDSCGSQCTKKDGRGPCNGNHICRGYTMRVMKGGSWYWPTKHILSSFRRLEHPESGGHRLSFRCASSTPQLTNTPAWMLRHAIEKNNNERIEDSDSLKIATALQTQPFVLKRCQRPAWKKQYCNDKARRVDEMYLVKPYIKNLGGIVLAVARIESYQLIAMANSGRAWLLSDSEKNFQMHSFLLGAIKKNALLVSYLHYLNETLKNKETSTFVFASFKTIASNENEYSTLRKLVENNRLHLIRYDLVAQKSFLALANAIKQEKQTVQILYLADIEEQLRKYGRTFRENIQALPFDISSLVLRSISKKVRGRRSRYIWHLAKNNWHYSLQSARFFAKSMNDKYFFNLNYFKPYRIITQKANVSQIKIPGSLPKNLADVFYNKQ